MRRQSARVRDNQRKRVYRSEHNVFRDWPQRFDDHEQVCDFIMLVMRDEHVVNYYGIIAGVRLWLGGNFKNAKHMYRKNGTKNIFRLPTWSWYKPMLLHELAHGYTYLNHDFNNVQGHGPEFCRVYLDLVNLFIDNDTGYKLAMAFKTNRVKF